MVKKIKKLLILLSFVLVFVVNINFTFAAIVNCGGGAGQAECTVNDLFGSGAGGDSFWIKFINMALGISGIVILCIFVYSGINIMLFGSDPKKLKQSVDSMKGSFIGILLVFFAFTIVKSSLAILVGEKWSIFFGQEINNAAPSSTGTGVPPAPTTSTITSISITGCPTSLSIGNTVKLSVVVLPASAANKNVTWTPVVSASTPATVDSTGLVTAKAVGTATITATSVINSAIKGTCNINVIAATTSSCSIYNDSICSSKRCILIHEPKNTCAPKSLSYAGSLKIGGINNGENCGTGGKCIYVKQEYIDETYYRNSWNLADAKCDGRNASGSIGESGAKSDPAFCVSDGDKYYCLRCVTESVYNDIK